MNEFITRILITFGANIPFGKNTPEATILAAMTALSFAGLPVSRMSRLFRTPCFPRDTGPDYVNAAAEVTLRHNAPPLEILDKLHGIELQFGRVRDERWGMRTLDIDLIAVDDSVLPDCVIQRKWRELPMQAQVHSTPNQLILPHPRMQDRAFVLVPLCDVAPDWRHPLLGLTVVEMLADIPVAEQQSVVPLPAVVNFD